MDESGKKHQPALQKRVTWDIAPCSGEAEGYILVPSTPSLATKWMMTNFNQHLSSWLSDLAWPNLSKSTNLLHGRQMLGTYMSFEDE